MRIRKLCPLCGGKLLIEHEYDGQQDHPFLVCDSCFLEYGYFAFQTVEALIESFEDDAENKRTLGKTKPKAVVKIDMHGNVLERYRSLSEAAKKNPMSKTAIENRTKGKLKAEFSVCDFSFRLEEDTMKRKGD